tara:strand:+ start:2193 stop:2462 length:270 start_codon:yes stop_codon:yes gene_type:complete
MRPTREDLIEMGYLKPGDSHARAPKRERKIFLTDSDRDYAKRHDLTPQEMIDFKKDVIIEEEILNDHRLLAAQSKDEMYNSPQAHYMAW